MNERIQKLAAQALDKVTPYTWTKLDYDEIQKLQEYFAELIVRECAAVALREDHEPHECILNHFGVKEDMTETNEWEITLEETIKRGTKAWAGVDATKWVDELRGDDEPITPSTLIQNREWVGLTADEIPIKKVGDFDVVNFARYIEMVLKEKNCES
jgi:hypothetical protein